MFLSYVSYPLWMGWCGRGGIGRRNGLKQMSAPEETPDVELLKFGETFRMAIPSQARQREGVETRRAAPKANVARVKG